MKKLYTLLASCLLGSSLLLSAQSLREVEIAEDAAAKAIVDKIKVERSQSKLLISANISLSQFPEGRNREVWIEPTLVSGDSSLALPTVIVAGKDRYIQGVRQGLPAKPFVTLSKRTSLDQVVNYSVQIPYLKWMDGSELSLNIKEKGCCGAQQSDKIMPLATINFAPEVFKPTFYWITPPDEAVKNREISGQAFIDFPVGQSEILPYYRANAKELAKIRASIDSVRTDRDATINSLNIHGFASPEGSYAINERLAQGRTEALKRYVEKLYSFQSGFITTNSTAEDWQGLTAWIKKSKLAFAKEILSIIESGQDPDAIEYQIRTEYPEEYSLLKEQVYPSLRRSDYKISYSVRHFSDPEEIIKIAQTRPQHLSLAEFFTAAHSLPEGSPTYRYLYETAARMFPESEIANLNAANAAMQQGALETAESYLQKAGNGPEATYARGILEALKGNYSSACNLFQDAATHKIGDADAAIKQINSLENN